MQKKGDVREESAPSLILSALLSVFWIASAVALPQCRPMVCRVSPMYLQSCRRYARWKRADKNAPVVHFLSIFSPETTLSVFSPVLSITACLHLHFNKRCGKRTSRRSFLVSEERKWTKMRIDALRQRRGLPHNYVKAFHVMIKRKDALPLLLGST